jgi:hypothetical protein
MGYDELRLWVLHGYSLRDDTYTSQRIQVKIREWVKLAINMTSSSRLQV